MYEEMYDDAFLDSLVAGDTLDACILEFDFECPAGSAGSNVAFRYNFSSEEYNEYSNTSFNDVFGFFLNGTNIALLPDGITVVSINNVNGGNPFSVGAVNPAFFINNDLNDGGPFVDIEADGLTVVLTASAPINPFP
ncbi:MAG: choice-of-anchor L domain-containing protein, partial [Chloroflexi bacterium]|nr:choice-of-anchor L domain-containing protein [Chloroflexota bacterium]